MYVQLSEALDIYFTGFHQFQDYNLLTLPFEWIDTNNFVSRNKQ